MKLCSCAFSSFLYNTKFDSFSKSYFKKTSNDTLDYGQTLNSLQYLTIFIFSSCSGNLVGTEDTLYHSHLYPLSISSIVYISSFYLSASLLYSLILPSLNLFIFVLSLYLLFILLLGYISLISICLFPVSLSSCSPSLCPPPFPHGGRENRAGWTFPPLLSQSGKGTSQGGGGPARQRLRGYREQRIETQETGIERR